MTKTAFTIYNASAGSGKTFTLVKEYLKIIFNSDKKDVYKNILAITFTNKAVGEMKLRVIESLCEFAKETPNPKTLDLLDKICEESNLSHTQIRHKAKEVVKNIIHNYTAFDISTIDKFTSRVIRTFSHDLKLSSTFEIYLETENLLQEAVDALVSKAGEDKQLTGLLVDFALEKTDDDKSWDITRDIKEMGKLLSNENHRSHIASLKEKEISEFVALKSNLKKRIPELESESKEFGTKAMNLLTEKGVDLKSFSSGYFPNHIQYIIDGELKDSHKKYYQRQDIKINKNAADKLLIESISDELIQILSDAYKCYEKKNLYTAFLKNITPLSLLNSISSELTKIQEEQNILSIAEFNTIIHNEIQNQPAPFIYERMGERYRHFFIDEFQDTSEMQWKNLIPLIDNALSSEELSGERGSLMIVGDPKQSIYRWRGGRAEQFIELSKCENPFVNPDKSVQNLDTNYRSYSQVIEFNNDFFKHISKVFQNPDYEDLYLNHSYQKTNKKTGGYVNLSFINPTDIEDEQTKSDLYLDAILKTIDKALSNGFEYSDIAILTRKRDPGVLVASCLTENNIPILSPETLLISNNTEVKFLVNMLGFLHNPDNKETKAYFLFYLATYRQDKIPVHDFLSEGLSYKDETELERWLDSFGVTLSFGTLRKKPLYESVEMLVSGCLNSETNAYVQDFLDRILDHELRTQSGIGEFLEYWEQNSYKFSIPSPEGNNAVRIMTIHKSKGLEFPVVIFPFAEEKYSIGIKDKIWLNADEESFGLSTILVDNSGKVETFGEVAKKIYQEKKEEELLDNVNILYVALTRAEEQLYIISCMNVNDKDEPEKNNMSTFFIQYLNKKGVFESQKFVYEWGSEKKLSDKNQRVSIVKKIPSLKGRFSMQNIKISQKESMMWGTHRLEAIEFGNILHEVLSYIKDFEDVENAVSKSLESGLITVTQEEVVRNYINKIVLHPDLADFFSKNNRVLNEQTIIHKDMPLLKPDRVVINSQNEVLLIDYKTGNKNSSHKKQLETYENAIESMGYKVRKKVLVYIGEHLEVVNLHQI